MKLLITTQKVDKEDPVLGFFHRWVEEFAKHYEKVTVVALGVGEYSLPSNVEVLSLGKEEGGKFKTLRYVVRFYRYIFRKQDEYDVVFVHMNPEYIVLGGVFFRLWGKKITLWYNHKMGGIRARTAAFFADIVFYASPYAFMARFKKAKQMGAGIDMELFQNKKLRIMDQTPKILSLGRVSPVKDIDVIIKALLLLDKEGIIFQASIYGDPTDKDAAYYKKIRDIAKPLKDKKIVTFYKGIPNDKTVDIYNSHDIFINMTPSGSFDKTNIEAMASGAIVLTCNDSFRNIIPDQLLVKEGDIDDLANKIQYILSINKGEREKIEKQLRKIAVSGHGLGQLITNIVNTMQRV